MNYRKLLDSKYPWWKNEEEKTKFDPKAHMEESLFLGTTASKNGQPLMATDHLATVVRLLIDRVEALESAAAFEAQVPAGKKAATPTPAKRAVAEESAAE